MFRLQRKQRHDLPEKAQLSKYYEMDGALRAYANRMAVLGLLCGSAAVIALGLFAYVRLQPPVVIRVDQAGEATVVGGDTVRLSRGLVPPVQAQVNPGNGTGSTPSDIEGRAMARRFLSTYLTYTPANVERQYADALNMMTANLRRSHHEQISRGRHARKNQNRLHHVEHQDSLDRARSERAVDVSDFRRERNSPAQGAADRADREDGVPLSGASGVQRPNAATANGSLVGEFWEDQLVGERDIDLDQRSTLLDR